MRMIFPNTPSRLLDELSTDVNAFVESILSDEPSPRTDFSPAMDFADSSDAYELSIDLPGVDPDQIHVDVEDDHICVHGTRLAGSEPNPEHRRRVERSFGSFRRAVRLPKLVDKDAIVAKYEHGVLTVTLPKATKAARRVTVTHFGSESENS